MNSKSLLLFLLLSFTSTLFAAHPGHERIRIRNTQAGLIPRGGHIQGVQMLTIQGKQAIVFSGSSKSWSYYAIAYQETDRAYRVKYVKRIAQVPYKHAGGIQVCGHILAVGIEDNSLRDKSKILLFDISDPGNSDRLPLDSIAREGKYEEATAGATGITRYKNGYLLAVADWGPNNIDTYISDDTAKGNIHFKPFMSWHLQDAVSKGLAPAKWASFQAIQLYGESSNKVLFTGTARLRNKDIATTFTVDFKNNNMVLENGNNVRYSFTKGVSFRFGGGIMRQGDKVEVLATQRKPGRWIRVDVVR